MYAFMLEIILFAPFCNTLSAGYRVSEISLYQDTLASKFIVNGREFSVEKMAHSLLR